MLTLRDLNRATLARQHLLAPSPRSPGEVVAAVAGLQAQEPRPPYLGLWARLASFERSEAHAALHERALVRATMWRGTLHLVTAEDFAAFRPLLTPVLGGALAARFPGVSFDGVLEAAGELLAEGPMTFNELRPRLLERFPDINERALGYAVRMGSPLIMAPTGDPWSFPRDAAFGVPGIELAPAPVERLIERHLAAFGPATVADVQAWSGLSGLKPVMYGMPLERLRDDRGRELFDVPGAPLPGGSVAAPVRFLPEFDTLLLGFADRSRVVDPGFAVTTKNLRVRAVYLVDGFVAGTWQLKRTARAATVLLSPFLDVPVATLEEEALRLLAFAEPDATTHTVRIAP
ncbi:winged helix DNA-binding domain-containing protein [Nonomuraea sp. NBC_01738]|uniref:winged helix DNA-binding domain-containing protein n=1 Tax=Nonomuraea sp. NBC_01738 TaxID=2976003 RepID=UPI002E1262C0|nr:winged helix DNA-binding domain-containing protein [Nonomuraea sp. NBC_01738]